MSDGPFHQKIGSIAGGGLAAYSARNEEPQNLLLETFGGIFGGNVAARLPDVIDPPTSPFHRSIGHGIVPVGGALAVAGAKMCEWQEACRARARHFEARIAAEQDPVQRCWLALCAAFWRIAAGFIAGAVAGYASHVLLDSMTPMGLPVFA